MHAAAPADLIQCRIDDRQAAGHVAYVTVNNPRKHNALGIPGKRAIVDTFNQLAQDDKLRAAAGPVPPFFEAHCQKCHGGDKHTGDFQIEGLTDNLADLQNREKWLTVMEQLEAGDMPPMKEARAPA